MSTKIKMQTAIQILFRTITSKALEATCGLLSGGDNTTNKVTFYKNRIY